MCQNPFPQCLTATDFSAAHTTTVVHVLDIGCPLAKLRAFIADAPQWLPWTLPALQSVQPLPFGQWLLKTPDTVLKLRLCPTRGEQSLPDDFLYELLVPHTGSYQVLVHTGPTATGCQVAISLPRHQPLPLPGHTASVRHLLGLLRTL
jgi:hypothetical protein